MGQVPPPQLELHEPCEMQMPQLPCVQVARQLDPCGQALPSPARSAFEPAMSPELPAMSVVEAVAMSTVLDGLVSSQPRAQENTISEMNERVRILVSS